jgi:hypothetical protein
MTAVKAYYDGKTFIPLSPIKVAANQAAIVTVLDDTIGDTAHNAYLQFAGSLPDEDYREITEILKSTEQVDEHDW